MRMAVFIYVRGFAPLIHPESPTLPWDATSAERFIDAIAPSSSLAPSVSLSPSFA
jgi:hypothetical protein